MSEPPVLYESAEQVGVLTLNRPDARNSMTPELLDGFAETIQRATADTEIRALILTGHGNCFSAGANLKVSLQREGAKQTPEERSFAMYEPFLQVLDVQVPVIAALNGHAVGGGFGLSLLADIRIANRDSKYGANFARLGIHSGLGISYTLPRIIGAARAAELLFTGRLVRGSEALEIGLASYAVVAADVMARAQSIAREIVSAAPLAVQGMKASLRGDLRDRIREAARQEARLQSASLETQDAQEGLNAMLEKREPEFLGK